MPLPTLHPDRRIRVAIDGVDGAGKTTLADALAPLVAARGRPVIRASVDDFHNPRSHRYARGRYSPDGFYLNSYDYDSFRRLLLEPLSPGGSGQYVAKRFDLDNDRPFDLESATGAAGGGADRRRHLPAPSRAAILLGPFDTSESRFRRLAAARRRARRRASMRSIPTRRRHQRYVGGQKRYLAECDPEQSGRYRDRLQ